MLVGGTSEVLWLAVSQPFGLNTTVGADPSLHIFPVAFSIVKYPGSRTMPSTTTAFTISLRTTTGAGNSREHHQAKARRTRREAAAALLAWPKEARILLPVVVSLTRVSPGKPDDDNAGAGLKAVRDAIARQLGVDDGDKRWVLWNYRPPRRGKWAVEVELQPGILAPGQECRPAVPLPPECPQCLGAKAGDGQVHCAGRQRARGCRCGCVKTPGRRKRRRALKEMGLLERAGVLGRLHLPRCVRGGACQPGCPSASK
jgi:hypothetical protein